VRTKRLNLHSFGSHDASGNGLLVNIQTASTLNKDIYKTHLSTANKLRIGATTSKRSFTWESRNCYD
jgi:hypothetical protein